MDNLKGIFFRDFDNSYIPHIFRELYLDRVYAPYLEGKTGLNIIDAGCNQGLFSFYAHRYADKIIAIEPSKEHFAVMNHMFKFNQLDKIIAVNAAVGAENTKGLLHHNQNVTMYSLSEAVQDASSEAEETDILTLEKIMDDNGMEEADFLKLDVEGSEGQVICSESFEKIAHRIKAMVYEYHVWAGVSPNIINNALSDYGFKIVQIPSEATIFGAVRNG